MTKPIRVFDLTYPGNRIDNPDQEWARRIQALLKTIESEFSQAAVSFHFFATAQRERVTRINNRRDERLIEGKKRMERIRADAIANRGDWDSEIYWKHEDWRSGVWPNSYESKVIFIYAKIFLFSMDTILKCLETLCKEKSLDSVLRIRDDFKEAFPRLTDIRDTAYHMEDRARGLNRGC